MAASSGRGAVVHALAGEAAAGGGPGWAAAVASALARRAPTTLVVPPPGDGVDLSPWLVPSAPVPEVVVSAPTRTRWEDVRRARADRHDALTIVQSPHPPRLTFARSAAVLVDFPLTAVGGPKDRHRLDRYRWVVANSDFTARWIAERWGRRAEVLSPLVLPLPSLPKEPAIVVVGRFTGGTRTKGQLELVEAFRRLDPEVRSEWRLDLVGHVADVEYLARVRHAAAGLRVHLHLDAARPTVVDLLGRASLCWHACGIGADHDVHPERLEHFGISVVEAMAAGTVPLVLDAGGPAATVQGVAPTWQDLDELVSLTHRFVHDSHARDEAAAAGVRRAAGFGPEPFLARVDELFGDALS